MEASANFTEVLQQIFPYTSEVIIQEMVEMVLEANPYDTYEGKMENMINLLSGDGALGPMPDIVVHNNLQNGAAMIPTPSRNDVLYKNLTVVYTDADPGFLFRYCEEKPQGFDLESAIDELSEVGYDKLELDPITVWEQLKSTLPNADPSYLRREADRLVHLTQQDMDNFVQNAIEKNEYPTMQDYLKNKKELDEAALYTNFNVEKFLEEVSNPIEKFSDPKRKLILDQNSNETDNKYALQFLYNHYPFVRKVNIEKLFKWKNKNLVEICERLDHIGRNIRRPRSTEELPLENKNVALLQLVAYLKHKKAIKQVIKMKDENYRLAREEARKYNLLETCQCCFDDELIPEECFFCMKDCVFCKECVKRGAETVIGKGEWKFPCFSNCDSEFSLQILQMVLPKRAFERLAQKIASEEIKKANIDGLETCPFCDFAMVLPENEKIFKCINEECLMESCRECRHKAHVPLRCEEIEYDEDVRRRTFIEDKMTEALTRTCYQCKKTFIKTSGCNKMTCNCGAKMCYLCGVPVTDYTHFDRPGGCKLHTNDAQINLNRILDNARQAKDELGNVQIKFDPTVGIQDYYQN